MAVVGVSLRTRISGVGFVSPLSIDATYCAMRITPCESWPRRFARTSSAAIHAASDSGTPRAVKMRLARASRSSALTMGMVALLYPGVEIRLLVPSQFTSPYFVLGRRRSSRTTTYAPVASSLGPRLARNSERHHSPNSHEPELVGEALEYWSRWENASARWASPTPRRRQVWSRSGGEEALDGALAGPDTVGDSDAAVGAAREREAGMRRDRMLDRLDAAEMADQILRHRGGMPPHPGQHWRRRRAERPRDLGARQCLERGVVTREDALVERAAHEDTE